MRPVSERLTTDFFWRPPVRIGRASGLHALPPPEPSGVVRAHVRKAEAMLDRVPADLSPAQLLADRRRVAQALQHRLSLHVPERRSDPPNLLEKEEQEASAYRAWASAQDGRLDVSAVSSLVSALTGRLGIPRSGPVWLRNGNRRALAMSPALDAQRRLATVLIALDEGALGTGLVRAVRLHTLVLNAHAFPDGNGRLSRALFHHCLHASGLPKPYYLPLKTLSVLSRAGFELHMREADLRGTWDGLYDYFATAILLCVRKNG